MCVRPTGVGEAGLDEFVEQLVGDGGSSFVVSGHSLQRLLLPNPVLQHLRGRLHEVPLHVSAAEHGVLRLQTSQGNGTSGKGTGFPCFTVYRTQYK